jgi:predicted  nucleic acid-binding Zn-ribbon protein
VSRISIRVALAAAGILTVAAAGAQSPPAPGPVGCADLQAMQESQDKVRKSLGAIELMGQMLLDQAKRKNEDIEACSKAAGDPGCTPARQAKREEEVGKLMKQVRELRATRTTIENALKETSERLKELTAAQSGKDGCPDGKK